MTNQPKEKVYAKRQDNYKQKKEEIFKDALKQHREEKREEKKQESSKDSSG